MQGHARAVLQPAERLRHVEARRGNGRRQPRPPLRHPDGRPSGTASSRARGSRFTTPTPARAVSSASAICRALPPPCTKTAGPSATTSTSTTSWTRTCWSCQDDRAAGRVFNVGGGAAGHHKGIRRRRHAPVRVHRAGQGDRRVPLRRHPPHPVGHQRPARRSAGHRVARRPSPWRNTPRGWKGRRPGRILAEANARMRALGVVAGPQA